MNRRGVVLLLLVAMTAGLSVGCRRPSRATVSPEEAVARVKAVPEVAEWIRNVAVERPEDRVVIEVDSEDSGTYTVHAHEMVQDELGGHSATFGWYEVSKKDGMVRPVLP